ncbi:MAG: aromatic amino acid lyase family protein [Enterovirga sp.]|nr:aromatic amino acid lyase family protein [Enterovirga sp.]
MAAETTSASERRDGPDGGTSGRPRSAVVIEVGSGPVTIADLIAVACDGAEVALAPEVLPRLVQARSSLEASAAAGRAVYGLTTGLGAAVDTALAPSELAAFQRRVVPARAVGMGGHLTREEVRATLFARLCGLARGVSGITPGFLPAIRDMLNRGVHPVARRTGSLGEADLAPLAGLFLPFAGGGEAAFNGQVLPGPEALARAGIVPPALGPKDGIALINASAFTAATGALAAAELRGVLDAMAAAGALSLEAFRANLSVIDPRAVALRPAPGQAAASERLRGLLAGSDLMQPGAARRVQDPLSFRCLAPVLGLASLRLDEAEAAVATELSGAADSPALLAGTGEFVSTVNFDTTAIALCFEALGLALAHAATISAFRIVKLMSPGLSDLPRFLARQGGSRTGFATVQKTAAALEAEIRHLAVPVGPMTMAVADGVEDYAPMTPRVIDKTRMLGDAASRLAAIELVVAAAAVDQRGGIRLGTGTGRAQALVRGMVDPFDEDRATGEEFEAVSEAIRAGAFRAEAVAA